MTLWIGFEERVPTKNESPSSGSLSRSIASMEPREPTSGNFGIDFEGPLIFCGEGRHYVNPDRKTKQDKVWPVIGVKVSRNTNSIRSELT